MRGRSRKLLGDYAERIVQTHWAILFHRRIAWVFKIPTPYKVIRHSATDATFTGAWVQRSPFDYCGYTRSGKFIAIEVKRIQLEQLKLGWSSIRFDINMLSEYQQRELFKAYSSGCLVFVVLVVAQGQSNRLFALPFAEVLNAMSVNSKSIKQSILEQYETKSDSCLLENELRGK